MLGPVTELERLQRFIVPRSINFGQEDDIAFGMRDQELTIERNVDVSE
jgi:hypothetical protein